MMTALVTLLSAPSALAAPSAEILDRIEAGYHRDVRAVELSRGRSMNFCPTMDLQLEVRDAIHGQPATVSLRIYEPSAFSRGGKDRSVILVPPTGGENILDRGYANALCARGFRVALLQTWTHQTDVDLNLTIHDQGAIRALTSVRHVLDYLRPQRADQVGILGTSVGALTSSLALGFDPRLNHGALIVGGANLAEIYAATTEKGGAALREARKKKFGFRDVKEYEAALRENIQVEPIEFANYSGRKNVLAVVATQDVTVPTKNQEDLVELFGAKRLDYNGDHFAAILGTYTWHRGEIVDFFERSLR